MPLLNMLCNTLSRTPFRVLVREGSSGDLVGGSSSLALPVFWCLPLRELRGVVPQIRTLYWAKAPRQRRLCLTEGAR